MMQALAKSGFDFHGDLFTGKLVEPRLNELQQRSVGRLLAEFDLERRAGVPDGSETARAGKCGQKLATVGQISR